MANPRNTVKFDGIAEEMATYLIDGVTITHDSGEEGGSAVVGRAVTLSANNTVALAADGQAILGKLIKVEGDGKATVQFAGYVHLPGGNGATLTRGKKIVGALGAGGALGYIREVATATAAELGVARGVIQDTSDPTETWVLL